MSDFRIIIILKNEFEAQLLDSVLNQREIPHLIKSYHDYALDGIFQMQKGWGQLEAPEQYKDEILGIYAEISKGQFDQLEYITLSTRFGDMAIVWSGKDDLLLIEEVILPRQSTSIDAIIREMYGEATHGSSEIVEALIKKIRKYFQGEVVKFELDMFNMDRCTPFQKEVLLAEYEIPRGRVSTYGRIARLLGKSGASRAVGNALANNPFPIVIPCHRAVQSNGRLGGYQGGIDMKKKLLEMEGVKLKNNRVLVNNYYYDET